MVKSLSPSLIKCNFDQESGQPEKNFLKLSRIAVGGS